ncbi:LuxR C-terminal-related transcriptional regulator [Actinomadura atramentaria]|uniref:LuxR C-terminal-related transcriptional regulator n=1 Tax=Actinomadura atramentaria TaxID=1990 RepID=UPI0003A84C63|nr:LuxR C-terminal-related transcriptional regulator [Actinomadura atramentaria]
MTTQNPPGGSNLPAETDVFVGRGRDVADLCGLVASERVVTLCGPGGIGKTRLAVRVARSLVGAHPGGVRFVDLADAPADGPPGTVGRRVAAALEIAEDDDRAAAGVIAEAVGGRDVLLVLDNCEHLVEDCAELAGVLLSRCAGLRVLATSREPLRMAAETVFRVPPLEPGEAAQLFIARARAVRPDFAVTDAVGEVSRALDGVPLALELAAARVRVLSAEQIAARLTDRFRLLSAGDRTAPPRQRTLRAAIDWSYELLGDAERVMLRRLSVFAGWTLAQVEQVCCDDPPALTGLDGNDPLDLLTALSDKSLAVVAGEVAGETRFRLLDSIRQYAAEHLSAAGEDAEVRTRHRDAVLEAAERHAEIALAEIPATWEERVALFQRYDAEMQNVRAALAWSLDRGEFEEGLRICTALRTYWITRGRLGEWIEMTDRFLVGALGAPAFVYGPGCAGRAQLAIGARDLDNARVWAERALEPCRKAGDDFMTAVALTTLAETDVAAGRFAEAVARLDEADAVAAAERQEWNRAYARLVRGRLRVRQGRLRDARDLLEQGLAGMREIGQEWGAAHALSGLGRVAALRGDLAAADACYRAALPPLAEVGARPERARALAGLGRVALARGDAAAARGALTESLELSRSTGIRADVARSLLAFAELAAREGDDRGAVVLAGAGTALRDAAAASAGPPAAARTSPYTAGPYTTGPHTAGPYTTSPYTAPRTRAGGGARLEGLLEPIRRRLGEPQVARLWGQGRVTTQDEAVARALAGPCAEPEAEPAPVPPLVPAPSPPGGGVVGAATPASTLTAREREIARLVERGLSNRGIAEELVISPATVARHVTNILGKLGFSSRSQVAAWAVDHIPEGSPE